MKIPKEAVPFIIFQRTGFLNLGKFKIIRSIIKLPIIYILAARVESIFFHKRIIDSYNSEIVSEFETIKNNLPLECSYVLDIGCGIAGIDVLINNFFNSKTQPDFHLLDKSYTEKAIWYDYKSSGAFYNSLQLALKVLELNGVDAEKITLHEVGRSESWKEANKFDLVISILSCGFHYPVETYINSIYNCLKKGGVLILDIRKGTDGLEKIKSKFGNTEIILSSEKFYRITAKKI